LFFLFTCFFLIKFKRSGLALAASIIQMWAPKVVITFVDNNGDVGLLKKMFPSTVMISVQNGTRWDLSRPHQQKMYFDHYFCFGGVEKDILFKGGCSYKHIHSVGSLRLGYAIAENVPLNICYDVCFISQFDPVDDGLLDDWDGEVLNVGRRLAKVVADFSLLNNFSFSIAMRHATNSVHFNKECEYYRDIFGEGVELFPNVGSSSYKLALESKLSVTISSTLGYEMLGAGNRVIFGKDIDEVASIVLKGGWDYNYATVNLPEYQRLYSLDMEEFSFKASMLLNMSDEKYGEYSNCARSYYMNFNAELLPQKAIMNRILCALKKD